MRLPYHWSLYGAGFAGTTLKYNDGQLCIFWACLMSATICLACCRVTLVMTRAATAIESMALVE